MPRHISIRPGQLPTVYGQVYSAVSVPSVQATTTDPVTIASVTLPNGTYHIEALVCSIHGAAGGVELGLASDHLIRVGLLNLHGKDEDQMTNTPVVNDGTNLITRAAEGRITRVSGAAFCKCSRETQRSA